MNIDTLQIASAEPADLDRLFHPQSNPARDNDNAQADRDRAATSQG